MGRHTQREGIDIFLISGENFCQLWLNLAGLLPFSDRSIGQRYSESSVDVRGAFRHWSIRQKWNPWRKTARKRFLATRAFDDASWLCTDVNWLSMQVPRSYFYRGRQGQSAHLRVQRSLVSGQSRALQPTEVTLTIRRGQNQKPIRFLLLSLCGLLRGCVSIICVSVRAELWLEWRVLGPVVEPGILMIQARELFYFFLPCS